MENKPALPLPPALWWCDTFGMTGFQPTLFVDISAVGPGKIERLTSHESQLARGPGGASHPFATLVASRWSPAAANLSSPTPKPSAPT